MADHKEPTPAEEAASRAKEAAEQAALPYKWQQDIKELSVTFTVPGNIKSRDLVISITQDKLSAGIKGQTPVIGEEVDGVKQNKLAQEIKVDDSTWTLATNPDGTKTVEILLAKRKQEWWPNVIQGTAAIDVTKIQPENSKLSDLDGETRGMVEKMMFDQRQKEQGLPTSDEQKKADILKKFQAQHPEMDFSKAKIQ
ncbi:CS-like domain-containing protein [Pochonia chlamydosporia 170]|uniref:Nuclear movement protein nudC n=1 Tax=Pochonia chlamydosporia 170 TaxID=1380566 RepID=A0A179FBK3_METCM|nr:CS-like domain-containing protein [Pochonia chlamydosporia 170]OAQ62842.1 CS-like domain-containing protein [Pochonia chlamydosporia 170]